MQVMGGTLARYFGLRFLSAVLMVFAGIFALVALIDYIELMRRAGDIPNVSAVLVAKTSFYRVPQVVERIPPVCRHGSLFRRRLWLHSSSASLQPPSTIRCRRYFKSAPSALKPNYLVKL